MTIEVATKISELDHNLPNFDDFVSEGDDHIRLFKKVVKDNLHNVTGIIDASHTEINRLVGITSSVIDVAKLASLPAAVGTTTPVASTWTNVTINTLMRAIGAGAVGLATDLHPGQFGPTSGANLAVDGGALQGRNAGAVAPLTLQALGGLLTVGGTADVTNVILLRNLRTQIRSNNSLALMIQNSLDGAPALGAAIDLSAGFYSSSGTRRAFLGFPASIDFYVQNDSLAGALRLRGTTGAAAVREMAVFNPGGAVQLSYDSTVRLQTSATGAIVTGIHQTDQLNVVGSGANALDGVWNFGALSNIIARAIAASLAGNSGFQVGPSSGLNIAISAQEIQGRLNGAFSGFWLQRLGGNLQIGPDAGGRAFWNDSTRTFQLLDGASFLLSSGNMQVQGTSQHNFSGILNAVSTLRRNNQDVVDVNRAVNTATGLQGGGSLVADRTIDYDLQALGSQPKLEIGDLFLSRDISVAGAGSHTKTTWEQIKQEYQIVRSADAVLTVTDIYTEQIWSSSGNGTLTLPPAANPGSKIRFRKFSTGNLTIIGYGILVGSYDTITRQGGMAEAVVEGSTWVLHGDLGDPLTNGRYESSGVAVTTSGAFTHGLGGVPDGFEIVLRATGAVLGYAAGDEVKLLSGFTGGGDPTSWANATQIGWAMASATPSIFQKGSAASGVVTGSWSIVGRAWRYRA